MIPYKELRARIERDKARKNERRCDFRAEYDCLEKVFTPRHYLHGVRTCKKNVGFKYSVQNYYAHPLGHIMDDCKQMLDCDVPMITSSEKTVIRERGKERIITPIKIRDRVNQRVLCDYALTPLVSRRLIYDNGASMKGKGVSFARNRFNGMLEGAKRMWGDDFYAMTFDFEHFFDNIPHSLCLEEMRRTFQDQRLADIVMQVVESYQIKDAIDAGDREAVARLKRHEGKGVCLGSHVSQLMALCVPNYLDHFLKDEKGVRFYIRYMDDGIILHNDKAYLKRLMEEMISLCEAHGMPLNRKKTRITHIRKGVAFLKTRYRVVGMKTVKRLARSSIIRMRRRLTRFAGLVERGKMTMKMVWDSMQSWQGHSRCAMAYRQRRRMMELYESLFGRSDEWRCVVS